MLSDQVLLRPLSRLTDMTENPTLPGYITGARDREIHSGKLILGSLIKTNGNGLDKTLQGTILTETEVTVDYGYTKK